MTKHLNIPVCPKCADILAAYPNFHKDLAAWVLDVRTRHNDAHISAAGRGRQEQELFFSKGTSRAHYGQSAHNYNAAVDWFRITQAGGASFDTPWYQAVIGVEAMKVPWIRWYGTPPISFLEYPHCEVSSWVKLAQAGQLSLVDGPATYPLPTS